MIIRVNPSLLKDFVTTMKGVGSDVVALGSNAASAAQGAPSYNGQFGPKVAAIGAEAMSRVNAFTFHVDNLSDRLYQKAIEFQGADTAAIERLTWGYKDWQDWQSQMLAKWSKVIGIPVAALEAYLKLGTLMGGTSFFGWLFGFVIPNTLISWSGRTFLGIPLPSWRPFGQTKTPTPASEQSATTTNPSPSANAQATKDNSTQPKPLSTSPSLVFISQKNPTGDKDILKMMINKDGKTVSDDIRAEGCQMTDYAMILNDKGFDVSMTDIYKANWAMTNSGKTWDPVNVMANGESTFIKVDMSKLTKGKYTQVAAQITGTSDQTKQESLATLLKNGPVILHVEKTGISNHYIVVDQALGDGSFAVRDPLSNQAQTIQIGSNGNYNFNSDGVVRMLAPISR